MENRNPELAPIAIEAVNALHKQLRKAHNILSTALKQTTPPKQIQTVLWYAAPDAVKEYNEAIKSMARARDKLARGAIKARNQRDKWEKILVDSKSSD